MSDIAIRVQNLGKQYHIGALLKNGGHYNYKSLRDSIAGMASMPIRAARSLVGAKAPARSPEDDTIWALKDVSFDVRHGEIVGVIGRNGAGKSTLLKLLSRITEPTTGRVEIHGRVGSLLEVGTGFHPELTGRDNVFLNGAILGMKRTEIAKNFDAIVAFAEVEKFIDTPVKHYSSGMYLRLAFAVAAHLQTEILIVDEVLAVGDADFQRKCLGKMQDVSSKEGRTVLFVSHSMSAITQLCSRAILIRNGSVALDGEVMRIASAYLSDASESEDGDFDLSSHPARARTSRAVIRRIRVYGSKHNTTSQLYPDEQCAIEIDFEFPEPKRGLRWAIAIEDYLGRRIMTFSSYFQESDIADVQQVGTLRCLTGPLNLGTGRYLLSVSVGDKERDLIDSIHNAAWFEINWNNNYANGEPYDEIFGPVLRMSEWELMNAG